MKIVTSEQMRRIEARSEQAGVSTDTLMERAGLEVARRARHHLGHLVGVRVAVMVGPGNNGGDGLVAARHLHTWGARVALYLCVDRRQPDPKLDVVRSQDVTTLEASQDEGLVHLRDMLASAHVVIDSVLGTGRARPLEGTLRAIMLELSAAKARRGELRVLALDLPTGLDADTGAVDAACPRADVTVTLGYPKAGLYAYPGADRTGSLEFVDIGIPPGVDEDVGLELMTPAWAQRLLPRRPPGAHKGTFGKTLIVAGSPNYIGAAYLAATAATRSGAGLVTLAIPESLQSAVAAKATEPTFLPLPESTPGTVSAAAASLIVENIDGYDALLLGCGIGQAASTRKMVEGLLFSDTRLPPTVIDADGLNLLSLTKDWWQRFARPAIVTPHPGEMSRLLAVPTTTIQEDRIGEATESAVRWNKVTVLKGAHTVVAFPGGEAMLSPFANPGLASAGTGDVLAGTIAGLVSQGLGLEDSAALGVYLHAMAGERVRAELGVAGMIASDLLPALPQAIKALASDPSK